MYINIHTYIQTHTYIHMCMYMHMYMYLVLPSGLHESGLLFDCGAVTLGPLMGLVAPIGPRCYIRHPSPTLIAPAPLRSLLPSRSHPFCLQPTFYFPYIWGGSGGGAT